MNIGRGYQGMTLLSNGQAFTLGGSWSGVLGGKLGEVWSPTGRLAGADQRPGHTRCTPPTPRASTGPTTTAGSSPARGATSSRPDRRSR